MSKGNFQINMLDLYKSHPMASLSPAKVSAQSVSSQSCVGFVGQETQESIDILSSQTVNLIEVVVESHGSDGEHLINGRSGRKRRSGVDEDVKGGTKQYS